MRMAHIMPERYVGRLWNTVPMAYDHALADEVRAALPRDVSIQEKAMFGGLAFLVDGNMAVSASGRGGLLVRTDPAGVDALLGPGVEPMVMRGRPMPGWLFVEGPAIDGQQAVTAWVRRGVAFARTLPPK
jgi:TfoX/Sxy family transcriptional regulator of competence genes